MMNALKAAALVPLAVFVLLTWSAMAFAAEPVPASQPAAAKQESPANQTSESPVSPPSQAPNASRSASDERPAAASQKPAAIASGTRRTNDRLELDTTVVTGNRELPKVLYIVPWKKADIGDLPSQPFNTLLDEALTPVDRDVFRREVTYYGAVSGNADAAAPAAPSRAGGPEK